MSELEEVYIEGESELVSVSILNKLVRNTPNRHHLFLWKCVYSMTRDGVSFNHLLTLLHDRPCSLLLIKDMAGTCFGGFASVPIVSNGQALNQYYGTGECWVFTVQKHKEERPPPPLLQQSSLPRIQEKEQPSATAASNQSASSAVSSSSPSSSSSSSSSDSVPSDCIVYRWSGLNDFFLFTGANPAFLAMGGGSAYAWRLDADFRFGQSGPCETFQSPVLASGTDFEAILFEVWCPVRQKF